MKKRILADWRLFWPVQVLLCALCALLSAFLPLLLPTAALPLRILFQWIASAALGAWTSFRLTRAGLTCYAAWLVPPVLHTAVPWLTIGFPPSVGSMLVCALVSMTAAAAADVYVRRKRK